MVVGGDGIGVKPPWGLENTIQAVREGWRVGGLGGGQIILTLVCLKESLEQIPLMKQAVIR